MTHHPAPIALFVFKRPQHTARVIQHLMACAGFERHPVFVFGDGARSDAELVDVQATRSVVHDLLGERPTYIERDVNMGLAKSIAEGVTRLCNEFGKVIVVEDDLLVAPGFLQFIDRALEKYEAEPRVMQVGGYMFDVPRLASENTAQFLPLTSSWGWGTWKRAWDHFDLAAPESLEQLEHRDQRKSFNLDGHFNFMRMLEKQKRGELDTWDIQWYYTVWSRGGVGLYPPQTLVNNTGFDGSGTHYTHASQSHQATLSGEATFGLPDKIEESRFKKDVYAAIRRSVIQSRMSKLRSMVISSLNPRR